MAILTLAEAKAHLRVSHSSDDTIITAHIATAEKVIEAYTGYVGTQREEAMVFDAFADELLLPKYPVDTASVVVTYMDTAGATQTVDASEYRIYERLGRTRISPAIGKSWPAVACIRNAVTVTADVGYAVDDEPDPTAQSLAVLLVRALYDGFEGDLFKAPGVKTFLGQLR